MEVGGPVQYISAICKPYIAEVQHLPIGEPWSVEVHLHRWDYAASDGCLSAGLQA